MHPAPSPNSSSKTYTANKFILKIKAESLVSIQEDTPAKYAPDMHKKPFLEHYKNNKD